MHEWSCSSSLLLGVLLTIPRVSTQRRLCTRMQAHEFAHLLGATHDCCVNCDYNRVARGLAHPCPSHSNPISANTTSGRSTLRPSARDHSKPNPCLTAHVKQVCRHAAAKDFVVRVSGTLCSLASISYAESRFTQQRLMCLHSSDACHCVPGPPPSLCATHMLADAQPCTQTQRVTLQLWSTMQPEC